MRGYPPPSDWRQRQIAAGQTSLWPWAESRQQASRHARRDYYQTYMASLKWQRRREEAMERAGYQCQDCGAEERFDVHHVTYEHLGDEWPEDLVVLCKSCHDVWHEWAAA
jgi:5-methylcytosine-specific restriction endonuclease McrA